jgi:L-lactate dehydrogenase
MITAGANEKTGGATDRNDPAGRLRLLDTNAAIYQSIIPLLHAVAPEALVLAQIVGEHGTTEVFLWVFGPYWGKARVRLLEPISGQNRKELRHEIERQVRYANIAIIEGIGASQHGIGMACARIAEILLRDEPAVIPIASYNPEYGVTLSLLSVLGRCGAARIIEPPMSDKEREALKRSADTLKSALARIQFSPS